jgi:hypothetical protein
MLYELREEELMDVSGGGILGDLIEVVATTATVLALVGVSATVGLPVVVIVGLTYLTVSAPYY